MRVMVMVKATKESEAGVMPSTRLLAEMGAFNEELVKAGIMLAGEGLHPSGKGLRIDFGKGGPRVSAGPFAGTSDLVAGYWLWKVKSLEEAVAWGRRMPQEEGIQGQIEIRPVFEAEDFGEAFTPELREREERLRSRL
jgi:hypothetical protein